MKFEEVSLTDYLVKNLEPLTEADPEILAKYVVALLKKDKPSKELQNLCTDNLVEFLGNGAKSFTTKLFQALEDGTIVKVDRTLDVIQKSDPSQAPSAEGLHPSKNSSSKEENDSSSSEPSSDPEDKEVSDDDDDDRNHKHRRREARPNSLETDTQEQFVRKPNRKRNKHYDNGKTFLDTDLHLGETRKEYNPTSERNISSKFDKRHSDLTPLLRAPLDLGPRTRFSQPLRNDPGPRFDLSSSVGRPIGRGRGRSTVLWSQHDSRFNPHDMLDFASQMASQGPGHPNLFVGTGLPSAPSTQGSSWGGFGFIPGMSNGIMDPLNPLGLQGALGPTINPSLNLGMPRQRCRDFEERGFCLRGDMCPMEHGLNRIVVEDVQSLSQFNLPVPVPTSHSLGIQSGSGPLPQSGSGPLPQGTASSGQFTSAKSISSKSSKSAVMDNVLKLNDIPSTSAGADADVYDPDQPLWNNDRPDSSAALLKLPSPNIEDEPSWDGDSSARQSFRSEGIEGEVPSRKVTDTSQKTNSSVWGRIGSENKLHAGRGYPGNEMKGDREEAIDNCNAINQGKGSANTEIGSKATTARQFTRHADSRHKSGRAFHKALRTLYVNGIPQKSNRRDTLISHFQKFGEVIDIYIPLNSEKAFVQFSKREEAEAALKSPDAVMGNRFVKLSWANRDRISDDGQISGHNTSVQFLGAVATYVPSKQPASNGGNEISPVSTQRRSNTPVAETQTHVPGSVRSLMSNAPKPAPSLHKKLESLELLEELRKKQESLAKKRDDFRRQLDKYEKQAISNKKGDVVSEQAAKRHKVDPGSEADKAAIPKSLVQVTEKTLGKSNSEGALISNVSKNSSMLQQSLKNTNPTSSFPASLPNRYKLDNHSTTFRILPPLPADFASVAVIKDHFSHYGVISYVVLEDQEHTENEGLRPSENCSACVTFSARHFAERAYQNGKCWEGHNLQFKWLTVSPNSSIDYGIQETSLFSSPKISQSAGVQLNPVTSSSSSSYVEKSTCSVISEVAASGNVGLNRDIEAINCSPESLPKSPIDNS